MWWLVQSADWGYSTHMSAGAAAGRTFAVVAHATWMRKESPEGVVFADDGDARVVSVVRSRVSAGYSRAGEGAAARRMARMRSPAALRREWKAWRMRVSEPYQDDFRLLVRLTNAAAKDSGYSDVGEAWREELGMEDVVATVLSLWSEVKPLYRELHAYTRHQLLKLYGDAEVGPYIHAHLLGSLWAENWLALSDVLLPFPPTSPPWTFRNHSHLLRTAEHFYTRMGFDAMRPSFWSNSMFVKPKDRLVDCHAMAYDFGLNQDYRVRMCVGEGPSFAEAVHELGHVHYSASYRRLPARLRRPPNSAFHEAVGETLAMAAHSPRCARKTEPLINTLMKQALSKLVLLPWALTVEMWRYNLFSGGIQEADMIAKWWEFRKEFQGVDPPDLEGSLLFDPASKYHVALNIPYLRYFLSRFLEHHFLEALCSAAGHPLHDCCFVTSAAAGKRLRSMLSLGASVSWQRALWVLTRERRLSSKPLLKYYKPLHDWLIQYNSANNVTPSW